MKCTPRYLLSVLIVLLGLEGLAQTPVTYTSADIYLQVKKLNVLGSVLYIAAHPDDENTHLLTWLSKDRLYRTGYLSLTRGDGGQNLIGDEQGIALGLIRTQELLAARRIDGAEQFFSRAFDFGFSKSSSEALKLWDKEKILADVVWVIRKFQPDILITRFPEDARAGHGQHAASAILAREAFHAAADPSRFPEQLRYGVKPWQAKRILWNTYRFGGVNTTADDQFKVDVGAFNPFIGKSYGEIAAQSLSQHKSQGTGSSGARGSRWEYFSHVDGSKIQKDFLDGVDTSWGRIGAGGISDRITAILKNYVMAAPESSVPALVDLYKELSRLPAGYWTTQKMRETQRLIELCSGLWLEAFSDKQLAVQGDSLSLTVSMNNRLGAPVKIKSITLDNIDTVFSKELPKNTNFSFSRSIYIPDSKPVSQPYWLEQDMSEGSFNVRDQALIGRPESPAPIRVVFRLEIGGHSFDVERPAVYKYTDPVKGELYQPIAVVPPVSVSLDPAMVMFNSNAKKTHPVTAELKANRPLKGYQAGVSLEGNGETIRKAAQRFSVEKGFSRNYVFDIGGNTIRGTGQQRMGASVVLADSAGSQTYSLNMQAIKYDHIPDIYYFRKAAVNMVGIDLKTAGKRIGYIAGAGDKVPEALARMGYEVSILSAQDIQPNALRHFDAVIAGIRAYDIHPFLFQKNEIIKEYIREGGNYIVQYNTARQSWPSAAGPYPFDISRTRVTDEQSPVKLLMPEHAVFNFPNKIGPDDFKDWIQERGIYFAANLDPAFVAPLAMNDPGEKEEKGSLVIAEYGKGRFVYTGLVFFRELPAGVPGAYRLFANIIALNKKSK